VSAGRIAALRKVTWSYGSLGSDLLRNCYRVPHRTHVMLGLVGAEYGNPQEREFGLLSVAIP
jgi:hypothetical protein